jgi:L-serine dehydratase
MSTQRGRTASSPTRRWPTRSGAVPRLLALCREQGLAISQLMLENERAWRSDADTRRPARDRA